MKPESNILRTLTTEKEYAALVRELRNHQYDEFAERFLLKSGIPQGIIDILSEKLLYGIGLAAADCQGDIANLPPNGLLSEAQSVLLVIHTLSLQQAALVNDNMALETYFRLEPTTEDSGDY